MRCRFTIFLLALLLQISTSVSAQTKVISGTVTNDAGVLLPDVTVSVKGTRAATKTNKAGVYTISAAPGQTLVFTYVDHSRREILVGNSNQLDVQMVRATQQMEEVVVTAMDIKRNPRELGYSVQKVDGQEVKETQRENFVNALQGRVSGLTVTATTGNAGASSSIVLRGFNSLSLSNQPLFVIDGVIVDNQTIDENSDGGAKIGTVDRITPNNANRITDYNNRISDINPNDIESITVLKGPEATALYGSQASSGAIIITTRKPKSNKLALQYDNSFRIQKVTRFPDVYDFYSNGTNGDSSNVFRYFGPSYGANTQLYDNKNAFFKTGFSQTHNLGVDFGIKSSLFRLSMSYFDQDGIIPKNTYNRQTIRLSNTTKFGKLLDISPAVTFTHTENNKVLRSSSGFLLGCWFGLLQMILPNPREMMQIKSDYSIPILIWI
jgi:TonB-dependent SusC/RagA subfamily outer membrane receptor